MSVEFPSVPSPMLATPGTRADVGNDWGFEFKWDGARALFAVADDRLRMFSRSGQDVTVRYPDLARIPTVLIGSTAVLDGEIVALDDHARPDFSRLQQRMHLTERNAVAKMAQKVGVSFFIFDLLHFDGSDLTNEPYIDRHNRLLDLGLLGKGWQVPPAVNSLDAAMGAAGDLGLEGVVAKRLDSRYEPGKRSLDWRKIKSTRRQEFVVGGFTVGHAMRERSIGSLLVGYYTPAGAFRYAGRVGSGFSDDELAIFQRALVQEEVGESPFDNPPGDDPTVHFVHPAVVVEVDFAEWTPQHMLRHPVYKGVRTDKPPDQVIVDEAGLPGDPTDGTDG